MNLKNIKVGDRVWVGECARKEQIETVTRVTPTLIILGEGGEFDRYRRSNGRQTSGGMWREYIQDLASIEECTHFDAEQLAKQDREEAKAKKEEEVEKYRLALSTLFPKRVDAETPAASIQSDCNGPSSERASRLGRMWKVEFHNLTSDQVCELAGLVENMFARKEQQCQ